MTQKTEEILAFNISPYAVLNIGLIAAGAFIPVMAIPDIVRTLQLRL